MDNTVNSDASAQTNPFAKRAYTIRDRMRELGYQPKLSHCYEIMATAQGFANWPTMSALKVAGANSAIDENRPECPTAPLYPLFYNGGNQFEIIGPANETSLNELASKTIGSGSGAIIFSMSHEHGLERRWRAIAKQHDRAGDIEFITVRSEKIFKGSAGRKFPIIQCAGDRLDIILPALIDLAVKGILKLSPATFVRYISSANLDELISLAKQHCSEEIADTIERCIYVRNNILPSNWIDDTKLESRTATHLAEIFSLIGDAVNSCFPNLGKSFSIKNLLNLKKIIIFRVPESTAFDSYLDTSWKQSVSNDEEYAYVSYHRYFCNIVFDIVTALLNSDLGIGARTAAPMIVFDEFPQPAHFRRDSHISASARNNINICYSIDADSLAPRSEKERHAYEFNSFSRVSPKWLQDRLTEDNHNPLVKLTGN